MGKSKGPRRQSVDLEAAQRRILRDAKKAFRKKFGRDPLPHEPVFFDETKDVPTPIPEEIFRATALEALSNLPPQFTYAYNKTGRLLLLEELRDHCPPEVVEEWDAAIEEYLVRLEAGEDPLAAATEEPERQTDRLSDDERMERIHHAEKYPAFEGNFDLDMTIEILGATFNRKLRIEYKHTPDDEYYDLRTRSLQMGWLVTHVTLLSRPEPEPDDPSQVEYEWAEFGDFTALIPEAVWDKIYDKVDECCREEDARRRLKYLEPGGRA
jgi:hypothetical protein